MKHSKEIKRLESILQDTIHDINQLEIRKINLIERIHKLRYEK